MRSDFSLKIPKFEPCIAARRHFRRYACPKWKCCVTPSFKVDKEKRMGTYPWNYCTAQMKYETLRFARKQEGLEYNMEVKRDYLLLCSVTYEQHTRQGPRRVQLFTV